MRYYRDDGTCKIDDDSAFGWWLEDFVDGNPACDGKIAIFPIKSVQETLSDPEGFVKRIENCRENFYYQDPSPLKEKLTNMVSSNKLSASDRLDENLIKSNETLQTAGRKIKENRRGAREKLNFPQSEIVKLDRKATCAEKCLECIAFLHRDVETLKGKVKELQQEVLLVKVHLEEENERSRKLLRECRKFSRELKESNYLNEIVLLLMGKVEKIKSNNWPFRICSSVNENELNLII